jgi:hypothetical protein
VQSQCSHDLNNKWTKAERPVCRFTDGGQSGVYGVSRKLSPSTVDSAKAQKLLLQFKIIQVE